MASDVEMCSRSRGEARLALPDATGRGVQGCRTFAIARLRGEQLESSEANERYEQGDAFRRQFRIV
jgi:hypothetical protein